ncbi:MAG: UvrD-helicase domain-containing protein [Bacteroidales bacterium]|jgi:DNA helicase-2/ATP-dependent DNA helicase PcrA|nr:UvrD-helicase domain-containing protein [Bacteroidales bacterium]
MTKTEEILSQLNNSQQEAVKSINGPVMVVAGAGSGKTRVLTYRIAYMLEQDINPYNILALTFTNKAAKEMKERITSLVGEAKAKAVNMGTFHSVFYRILRIEGEKLGYTRNLTIYDTDDAKGVIKSIIKDLNLDPKIYPANYVLQRISAAKSSLISAQEYAKMPEVLEIDNMNGRPLISEIFLRYTMRLKNSDAMDFDDLLYYMNLLLRDFPDMLYKYQNRFKYILVDEYQDTNVAQYLIIKRFAAAHHNLCVVGDDAQSIYAFRGANIQNILNFKKDFPEAITIKLEQNYRSTQNIVHAANAIIKNNKHQIAKEIWTDNESGNKISILKAGSDHEEALFVARAIFEAKMNYQLNNNQFAILYRTSAQSRVLEEALSKSSIPYVIYGGLSFYKRKEIKNVLAYFRVAINHYDEESLLRIINYPQRSIGATTVDKLRVTAQELNVRIWDLICDPHQYPTLELITATKDKLKDFSLRIKSFSTMIPRTDAYELGKHIVQQSGIMQDLLADMSEKERVENVEALLDSMKEFTEKEPESMFIEDTGEIISDYFPSLDRFMESVSLLTDDESEDKEKMDKVKLMTIHASKGLEFEYVYLTGLEENLFPSSLSISSRSELEEERRLFYVAITRARKNLTITYAQTRYIFGSLQFCESSRFIDEIPPQFINSVEKAAAKKSDLSPYYPTPNSKQQLQSPYTKKSTSEVFSRPFVKVVSPAVHNLKDIGHEAAIDEILPEMRVYHAKFGFGMVQVLDGVGMEKRAVILFESVGEKTLLLKFAKLIIPKS